MALKNKVVILGKINEGMTNPNDISKSTGIPQYTVYRIVKKLRSGDGIDRKEVEVRPKKFAETDRRRRGQLVRCGKFRSLSDYQIGLIERGSPNVSRQTVLNELNDLGWVKMTAKPIRPLTDQQ